MRPAGRGSDDIDEPSVVAAALAASTNFQRLMRRSTFWPELAAAPAPTAERRMKPACRTINCERQCLEDLRQTIRLAKKVRREIVSVSQLPYTTHSLHVRSVGISRCFRGL